MEGWGVYLDVGHRLDLYRFPGLWRIPFPLIQDAGTNEGGDMSLSPHAAPALGDDYGAPVLELSHRASHSGGGETPFPRLACN